MNSSLVLVLLIVGSVILNTLGQMLLKSGSGQGMVNLTLFAGLVAYAISTVSYILILKRLNVSVAYPLVFGLTIIATTLAGANVLKESVTMQQWMGVGLVISGICAISFGKIS